MVATSTSERVRPAVSLRREKPVGAVVISGNFQGLGIVRSLAEKGVPVCLLDQSLCIGKFSRYIDKFFKCPDTRQESDFLEFLVNLAKNEGLEGWVVYPNDDETVRVLSQNKEELEKYYRLITPSWDIVRTAYDKKLTRQVAEKLGIDTPGTFYPEGISDLEQLDVKFPVIIKPTVKYPFYSITKKKAILVHDRQALIEEYRKASSVIEDARVMMIQEFIPGGAESLFSVGSLCRDGDLLARVVVRRPRQHPMDFGHATTYAETVNIPQLEEMAGRILGEIGFYGMSEVEFMQDARDGRYKLLEINARPWGWHTLAIEAGVDLPYLSYLDRLGEAVRHNGFAEGVKWIRLTTDIPTVLIEVLKGRMKLGKYLSSLRGKKRDAVFSLKDPLPFFAEIAMSLYLWRKWGF